MKFIILIVLMVSINSWGSGGGGGASTSSPSSSGSSKNSDFHELLDEGTEEIESEDKDEKAVEKSNDKDLINDESQSKKNKE